MISLKPGAHIHLMGICGTAMASLAGLLKEKGYKITGSDQNVYPPMSTQLADMGIEVMNGYRPENLNPRPDYVVIGNVISKHFPEAMAVEELKIPFGSLPETLRDFIIEDRHSLVVAGTHGKTTTTSMLAWACESAGLKPGYLIGGIPKNFSRSFKVPQGDVFVVEGDEYDSAFFAKCPKFLFYKPKSVILSSVEFDHADIYKDLDAVLDAFTALLKLIPQQDGLLVYHGEDANIAKILPHYAGKKVSYGRNQGDWTASHVEPLHQGLRFQINYHGKKESELFVPMFGEYNVLNALSVYALMKERSFKDMDWFEVFSNFKGVKRRQELLGEPNGIQVIEDFAHHPTAVDATLQSFLKRERKGKLFAIFEPRSNTSRRKLFQAEYTKALAGADRIFLSQPFVKEGAQTDLLNVDEIVGDLNKTTQASTFTDVDEAVSQIQKEAKPGDTIVIMSNGGFQGIYQKILTALA